MKFYSVLWNLHLYLIDFNEDVSNLSSFSINVGLEIEINMFYHVIDLPTAYSLKVLTEQVLNFF